MILGMALMVSTNVCANGGVTGTVLDKATAKPVDYATVVLVNPDTRAPLPMAALTGTDGVFVIADAPAGKYVVRVSMMGAVTQERTVTVADSIIDIGRIVLAEDTKLLREVVVAGRKGQLTITGERRVFHVGSSVAATGASANELLAAVPSVGVNADGEISLRGNTDVLIWINGKEMGMNADNRAQILRQIPAESVESVEVMTNPSSKHSTAGTAGIINIRLKEDGRHGLFGNAEANVDSRGTTHANLNLNHNEGKFESYVGIGLKSQRQPGGSDSRRTYADGTCLTSDGRDRKRENSLFLRAGTRFSPDDRNAVYLDAIGTLGHKWGRSETTHLSDRPDQWTRNVTRMRERGDTRGANVLLGYKHRFGVGHHVDMDVSYNVWKSPVDNWFHEDEIWADGTGESVWRSQRQDVNIGNWEAAVDYSVAPTDGLRLEAGYKGNYNREDSPASYAEGPDETHLAPLDHLYNRFKYDTDICALYVNLSGHCGRLTYAAGLRGELWQVRTRSLAYGQTDADTPLSRTSDFALFPSASLGWTFPAGDKLRLDYTRRIRRPYGPQLNTFENISDPAEVHLGNPLIRPEYSDGLELSYIRERGGHSLSLSAYLRSRRDMISHVSFLAPMAANPAVNTMYYGHANVGDMTNAGIEIISRNTLFGFLTLTTTANLYNSHLCGWRADYPLHGSYHALQGAGRNRFVWDVRCMASARLPWDITFQATGRYASRRITAQGLEDTDWDGEAGLRKEIGAWGLSLFCRDLFNSNRSRDILYGDGYTQTMGKWSGGRTLRLAVTYTFGKAHGHDHDYRNHVDTGGYGGEAHQH